MRVPASPAMLRSSTHCPYIFLSTSPHIAYGLQFKWSFCYLFLFCSSFFLSLFSPWPIKWPSLVIWSLTEKIVPSWRRSSSKVQALHVVEKQLWLVELHFLGQQYVTCLALVPKASKSSPGHKWKMMPQWLHLRHPKNRQSSWSDHWRCRHSVKLIGRLPKALSRSTEPFLRIWHWLLYTSRSCRKPWALIV